jgi:curved DNA-binding protein CbpA
MLQAYDVLMDGSKRMLYDINPECVYAAGI